jgi:NifU-like protein involved in Fe-S cluster formation
MLTNIYNERILDLAGNIPRLGRLAASDATAKAHSKLCGSTIIVDLIMHKGNVVDFAHDVKACALSQAAASIMARNVIGASGPELRALRDQVRDFKARHASTLLTFEATLDCVNQIENAARAAAE